MDSHLKVLIIEDDQEIRNLLMSEFQESGTEVLGLESGEGLLDQIDTINPSILLLDNLIPGKNGVEIVKEIRKNDTFSQVPILMISALDSESDKLRAFDAGVDDYVTKPFSVLEVMARAQALVRRTLGLGSKIKPRRLEAYGVVVDLFAHRVYVNTLEIKFTLTEYKILCELIRQLGLVLTRDQLRERALGNFNVSDRTIDVHMAAIRKKLQGVGDKIETVRGVGYRLGEEPHQTLETGGGSSRGSGSQLSPPPPGISPEEPTLPFPHLLC